MINLASRRTHRLLCLAVLAAACRSTSSNARDASSLATSPLLDPSAAHWLQHAPANYALILETSKGPVTLEITRALAPLGADRLYNLARAGFFDDSRFSRVVPNFIVQFGVPGDPRVSAVWKDRAFPDDSVRASNVRGAIAFAMTGPNTRTHQLFISLVDNSRLDTTGFSPLGRVVQGMDVVDRLYSGYGESSGGGMRRGNQGRVMAEGNAYLDAEFPRLDRLIRARVVTR